jgi:hypothetical protein
VLEIANGGKTGGTVTFASDAGGILLLDNSMRFHGFVAGFDQSDFIDLADIAFDGNATVGFSEAANGRNGTLSVTNGARSASFTYAVAGFSVQNDGAGGTLVTYNPDTTAQAQAEMISPLLNTTNHSGP